MLPVALPVAAGAKLAEMVALCPAASVNGKGAGALMLKPIPVTVAWDTVRAAVPESVRVRLWVLEEPSCTSPKSRLIGLAARAAMVGGFGLAGLVLVVVPTHPD
jgi:hypothetical protein